MNKLLLGSVFFVIGVFGAFYTACDIANATVNAVTARNDFLGNGVTTIFPFTFRILSTADVEVIVNGVTQILNVSYSVSGVGASGGGSITLFTPPTTGIKVALLRKQPLSQLSVYQPNEPFPAVRINNDFDKATMQSQMQAEQLNRSLHVAKYITPFTTEIDPTGQGGANICINNTATGFAFCTGGGGGGGIGGSGSPGQFAMWLSNTSLNGTDEPKFLGPTPWADARRHSSVSAALATSTNKVYLPAGSTWVTGRTLPDKKTVFGDGPTSVIGDGTGFLTIGPQGRLENVFIRDANTLPSLKGYLGLGLFYGLNGPVSYTSTGQDIGVDIWKGGATGTNSTVGVSVNHLGLGSGDNFYGQITSGATEFTDSIFRGDNFAGSPAGSGIYAAIQFATAHAKSRTLGFIDKRSSVDSSIAPIFMSWEAITGSAPLFYMTQTGATFVGDFISLNGAAGSGAFGGRFIIASLNGVNKFQVLFDGSVGIGGAIALNANGAIFASLQTSSGGLNFVCIDNGTKQFFNKATACNGVGGGGSVASVNGVINRTAVSGPATDPIIDIAAAYVGQTSITTLGTVTNGTWNVPGTTVTTNNLVTKGAVTTTVASTGIVDYDPANNAARLIGRGPNGSTQGQIRFVTTRGDGSNSINALIIDANGNVGIGTTGPTNKLHSVSSVTVGSQSTYPFVAGDSADQNRGVAIGYLAASEIGVIQPFKTGIAWEPLSLNPNGGNVGIGVISPGSKLHIAGGVQVGTPSGGNFDNAVNSQGGFFENGVKIAASGIIGSGANTQCTFWTGVSSLGGSNNCIWDNTNIGMTLTKVSVNTTSLFKMNSTNNAPSFANSKPLFIDATTSGVRTATGADFVTANNITNAYFKNTDSSTTTSTALGDRTQVNVMVHDVETPGFTGPAYTLVGIRESNGTSNVERAAIAPLHLVNSGGAGSYFSLNSFLGVKSSVTSIRLAIGNLNEVNCQIADCATKLEGFRAQNINSPFGTTTIGFAAYTALLRTGTTEAWNHILLGSPDGTAANARADWRGDGSLFLKTTASASTTIVDFRRDTRIGFQVDISDVAGSTAAVLDIGGILFRVRVLGANSCTAGNRCLVVDNAP